MSESVLLNDAASYRIVPHYCAMRGSPIIDPAWARTLAEPAGIGNVVFWATGRASVVLSHFPSTKPTWTLMVIWGTFPPSFHRQDSLLAVLHRSVRSHGWQPLLSRHAPLGCLRACRTSFCRSA